MHLEKKPGMDLGIKMHSHKNPKMNAFFVFDIIRGSAAHKAKKVKVGDQILEVFSVAVSRFPIVLGISSK